MRLKGLLANLGLCCCSLLLCLAATELVLILMKHNTYPDGYFRIDDTTGLLMAEPGYHGTRKSEYGSIAIRTNKLGFRGGSFSDRDHRRRVIILGDSFVQALQVEEQQTFGSLLAHSPAGVQVLQAGICGWGQGDQLRWLTEHHRRLRPDLVVVAAYLGNDPSIDNMKSGHMGSTGYLVSRHGHLLNRPGGLDNSRISRIKQQTIYRSRALLLLGRLVYTMGHQFNRWRGEPEWQSIRRNHRQSLRLYRRENRMQENFIRVFIDLIRQINRLGEENDFEVLVMCIPWHCTLDEERFRTEIEGCGLQPELFRADLPNNQIHRALVEHRIPLLDLRHVFLARPDPLQAFGAVDQHFSPTGHVWTVRALARDVQRLVPAS